MRMRLALPSPRALLAALLLAGGALGGASCAAASRPAVAEDLGAIMLYVDNRGWDDMVVYVMRGTLQDRLGRVSAASRWSVALDKWVINQGGTIRIVAQPAGSRYYGPGASASTQQLQLQPGQTLLWTIEKDLSRSFIELR